MRSLIVCTLLALMPLSSVRMVCFSPHAAGARPRPSIGPEPSHAADEDEDECTRVCLRRPAPPPPAAAVTCILVADPACELLATTPAAVMPHDVTIAVARVSSPFEPRPAAAYLPPTLDRRSPPPRA
jgi:hypothetical protein